MNGVDQIIKRELLGGRTVSIPFVGSLRVVRYGAQRDEDNGSIAPWRSVVLDSDFDYARSLIRVVANLFFAGDEARATDLYNLWLEAATVDRLLIIKGVCSISLDNFTITIDPSMEFKLRPAGVNPLSLGRAMLKEQRSEKYEQPRNSVGLKAVGRAMIAFSIVVMIAAATYVGYYWYVNKFL